MKTVMITGCSSGFGLEIAKYFLAHDWQVIATMRTPCDGILPNSDRLRILPLDVTDIDSIHNAVAAAGAIDVLVNNAGIGFLNALEGTPLQKIREIFETNTFGTMAMIQAVLPQFRAQKSGMIVNITSSVTLKSLPLLSIYTASKAAVNAFTKSLALELAQFNIRVGAVLPGRAPSTRFGENAGVQNLEFPEPYLALTQEVFSGWQESTEPVTYAEDVAKAVWYMVNTPAAPMLLPAGADAITWAEAANLEMV
jgi:NAD(P)-dependent dehydrogenase (short-subunit alcohol dehydrogenase family)